MRKKDKFADEKVCCFYEIDENFDDLNFLNIKNCDTEDKETENKDTKDKDKDKNKKNEKQTSLKFINNNFGKAFRFMQISPETDSKFSFKNF